MQIILMSLDDEWTEKAKGWYIFIFYFLQAR